MPSTKQSSSSYVVVDFLDLDVKKLECQAPRENSFGGKYIPLRYAGKKLYVRYEDEKRNNFICPFGVNTNSQDMTKEAPGKYPSDKKITGYSTSISLDKDYQNDPYWLKAAEIDDYLIDQCVANSVLWGLGGSATRPISRDVIEGYDDKGDKGKYKRMIKYASKVNKKTGEREYLEYAPRLEFGITTTNSKEIRGEDGLYHQSCEFTGGFFDEAKMKIPNVTSNNADEVLPKFSRISLIANWGSIALGTWGASMKPKIHQLQISPPSQLKNDVWLGASSAVDDEEEDDGPMEDLLGLGQATVKVEPVAVTTTPPPEEEEEEEEELEGEELEIEEEEEMEMVDEEPEPAPKPVTKKRVVRRVAKN